MGNLIRCVAVDDEILFLKYLQKAIKWESHGFELSAVCETSLDALQMIEKFRPEILLLDINMPNIDGFSLLHKLQSKPYFSEIHCVIISAHQTFEYAHKALRLSVDDYLCKPCKKEDLLNCLLSVQDKILQSNPPPELSGNFSHYKSILSADISARHLTRSKLLLRDIILYLMAHYAEKLSCEAVAEHFYISSSYLKKILAQEAGSSFTSVVEEIRLEKACELLASNQYYIANIAEMVGYHDPAYFTKVFKKKYRMTPTQYALVKQNHRGDLPTAK